MPIKIIEVGLLAEERKELFEVLASFSGAGSPDALDHAKGEVVCVVLDLMQASYEMGKADRSDHD